MKAAIYSRKSKFTGKGESIENQVQMCKDYAQNQLKDKNITEFLIYEDEGFSGGNTNRPEFQRLMEDAMIKKFDVLICYRLDRISRNVADFSSTLEILQKYDIDFVSIREQFDTSTPMGRAMMYVASVFAQLERETIAERVRDNMLELAKTGRWLGGVTPIGYKSNPVTYYDTEMNEKKMVKLTQVPEELKTVKLIYNKYLEFKSLSKVETYCLQNNIKTKRGSDFNKANIRLVLNNPVYVKATDEILEYLESKGITCCGIPDGEHGLLTYNKQKTIYGDNGKVVRVNRDTKEWIAAVSSQKGIIEASDWLKVQKILTENKDKVPNLGKTHNALLTGVLRCAKCGSTMQINHGHQSRKTGETIYYYACSMKKYSKSVRCNNKNAKVAELDLVVKNYLKKLAMNKKVLLAKLSEQNRKSKEFNNSMNREETLKKSIAEKEKQIENLINKLAIDDEISDLIINKIKSIKNEISELKKELVNIDTIKSQFNETEVNLSFISMLLDRCSIIDTLTDDEIKQLIYALIDKITWDGEKYEIEINFIGSNKENDEEYKKK
ncbi:Site-specific DNA recombinase [Clostridium sp. USBA 49]|uniref:recombinase family protein n=1 Tax=Clostridium sp. USBA 49 TaxID=1881060 RepID=UPI00099AC981|nr:recombinase family protein [Clostridium sp. USBA 49]SKA89484.1 Site-specific DNA recombinase [Clostridium sp. USBA 49]